MSFVYFLLLWFWGEIDKIILAMADGGMLLVYRGLTTEQLLELQQMYLEQLASMKGYTSMTAGGKSFTSDLRSLMGNLEAIQYVLNERGSGGKVGYDAVGVVDFSPQGHGQPAGTTDQLNF
jgi:hypothetical protein